MESSPKADKATRPYGTAETSGSGAPPSKPGARGLMRLRSEPTYLLFAAFSWFATLGYWIRRLASQWLVWEMTGSFAWLGIAAALQAGVFIVTSPLAGTLADRGDRLFLARCVRLLDIASALAMTALIAGGGLTLPLLLVMIGVFAVSEGFWMPVRLSLVPSLVSKDALPNAIALSATLFNLAQFVGPAIAGVLITRAGVDAAFAVTAATFVIFFIVLFLLPRVSRDPASGRAKSFLRDMRAGLDLAMRDGTLGPVILAAAMSSLSFRAVRDLLAGLADTQFNAGVDGLTWLASSIGIGALIGATMMANMADRWSLPHVMRRSMLANALLQLGFVAAPSLPVAALLAAGMGMTMTTTGVSGQIIMQRTVSDSARGRIASLWSMQVMAAPSLGAWIVGALAGWFGAPAGLALITAVFLLFWLFSRPPGQTGTEKREETT